MRAGGGGRLSLGFVAASAAARAGASVTAPVIAWLVGLSIVAAATVGHAQVAGAASAPQLHIVGSAGAGGQLHLTRDDALDQGRVAPAFVDTMVGVLWPLAGLHYGPALGAAVNLSDDGGYTEPVFAWQQWALMPAIYVARALDSDLPLLLHLGVPLVLQGPTELPGRRDGVTLGSAGLELGGALAYRLLAGVLGYAELDVNLWRGEGGSHLNGALELGVMIDYEVLP